MSESKINDSTTKMATAAVPLPPEDVDVLHASASGAGGDTRSWHDIIVEKSGKNIELLREAIVLVEKSLDEPKKLNAVLKDEQALIARLKALHVSQSQLQEENQSLFANNQNEALSFAYLEIAREKRRGEVIDVPTTKTKKKNKKTSSSPPPIQEVLERRRTSPRPESTLEEINETLVNAERRREALLSARVGAKKIRENQILKNLERIKAEREETALELKRKEYVAQQRHQVQQNLQRKEHEMRALKRRESAEKRKAQYDEFGQKIKERVGEPKRFTTVHAKQKQKIDEQAKLRTVKVQQMATAFATTETMEKLARPHAKSVDGTKLAPLAVASLLTTPIKSLVEAKKRRENPLNYYTPRSIAEAKVPRSADEEKRMHSVIIKELERLKAAATTAQDKRDLQHDIDTELAEHKKAMESLADRKDLPEIPLEFKFQSAAETPGKKRRKSSMKSSVPPGARRHETAGGGSAKKKGAGVADDDLSTTKKACSPSENEAAARN